MTNKKNLIKNIQYSIQKDINRIISREVSDYIYWAFKRKLAKRLCLNCRNVFTPTRRDMYFCSRRCYGQFHRIKGFVRKLLKHRD